MFVNKNSYTIIRKLLFVKMFIRILLNTYIRDLNTNICILRIYYIRIFLYEFFFTNNYLRLFYVRIFVIYEYSP